MKTILITALILAICEPCYAVFGPLNPEYGEGPKITGPTVTGKFSVRQVTPSLSYTIEDNADATDETPPDSDGYVKIGDVAITIIDNANRVVYVCVGSGTSLMSPGNLPIADTVLKTDSGSKLTIESLSTIGCLDGAVEGRMMQRISYLIPKAAVVPGLYTAGFSLNLYYQ